MAVSIRVAVLCANISQMFPCIRIISETVKKAVARVTHNSRDCSVWVARAQEPAWKTLQEILMQESLKVAMFSRERGHLSGSYEGLPR